jgi:hypothetical protein
MRMREIERGRMGTCVHNDRERTRYKMSGREEHEEWRSLFHVVVKTNGGECTEVCVRRFFSRHRHHVSNFSRFLPARARPYDFWCRSSYTIDTKNEYFSVGCL